MKTWEDIAVGSLIGTDRQAFLLPKAAGGMGGALRRLPEKSPEEQLLDAAAIAATWRKAGTVAAMRKNDQLVEAPDEARAACSSAAGRILRRILGEREGPVMTNCSRLEIEWLELAHRADRIVPSNCLAELLHEAIKDKSLRAKIASMGEKVIGRRGIWLARQNANWAFASGPAEKAEDSLWEEGVIEQRILFMDDLRVKEPEAARHLLATTWQQESAENRRIFLEILEKNIVPSDEPFLESALDDRSKPVRVVAARMLSQLPNSSFSRRMIERVGQFAKIEKKLLGKCKIAVVLPEEPDATMRRDGIEEVKNPPATMGAKGSLLHQMIALTPLEHWGASSSVNPEDLIAAARKTDWAFVLVNGWHRAACAQRNGLWLRALLKKARTKESEYDSNIILRHLPPRELHTSLAEVLEEGGKEGVNFMIEALQREEIALDAFLTRRLFQLLSAQYIEPLSYDYARAQFLTAAALTCAPSCLEEGREAARAILEKKPEWDKSIRKFLEVYELRCAMHKEIKQ